MEQHVHATYRYYRILNKRGREKNMFDIFTKQSRNGKKKSFAKKPMNMQSSFHRCLRFWKQTKTLSLSLSFSLSHTHTCTHECRVEYRREHIRQHFLIYERLWKPLIAGPLWQRQTTTTTSSPHQPIHIPAHTCMNWTLLSSEQKAEFITSAQ